MPSQNSTPRPHRRFTPLLETLEDRTAPAVGVNVFARFAAGAWTDPAGVSVLVHSGDFTLVRGRIGLAISLRTPSGSLFDPQAISILDSSGASPRTLVQRDDRAGETASLTLVNIAPGVTRLSLPAGSAGSGTTLEVSLLGDANGDFRVNHADWVLVSSLLGKQRGQAGFLRQADIDGDGQITLADRELLRANLGAATRLRPLALVGGLAATTDRDGNRIVLAPKITISGQSLAGATIRLDINDDGVFEQTKSADKYGRYSFQATVSPGVTAYSLVATDRFGQRAKVEADVTLGDVILDWNAVHLTAIRDYTTFSQVPYSNRIVFTAPPLAARNLAMVHAAMYDAVTLATGADQPFHATQVAVPGASAVAAAATAAQRILVALYPKAEQIALFNAALAESLASVPNGASKTAGIALGRQIGDAYLAWRSTDGAKTVKPYTPGSDPGKWRFTAPDFLPALVPQFPDVTPFVMETGAAFRPTAPPDLASAEYAAALNEVKELGRFDSTVRTAEQTEIAMFWSDGPGTFTPVGHWNQIASIVSTAQGNTLAENARLFAVLNLALADAGIACWDAKYAYNVWRPITAIREAASDGNPLTEPDPTWAPLIKTPNFPSYTSGHSTFSAAAATVLAAFFGDDTSFTMESDGLEGFTARPLRSTITRSFTSFSQAAAEAAVSRVYGGIHFAFDDNVGLEMGQAIGAYVLENWLAAGGG